MSETIVVEPVAAASPRLQARLAGVIAWITTTSGIAEFVRGGLVVPSNAAATAHNILAHETAFRLAFVGDAIAVLYIPYTLLLYWLLRPVHRRLALLAACFSLVGVAVGTLNALFALAPVVVLGGGPAYGALSGGQLRALALLSLDLHTQGYALSMVLFGTYNVLTGYLIVRSTFLPRVLGALLTLSGVCYLINSFATFIAPSFETHLLPYILLPGAAELLLALWLVVMGVNPQRWREQAEAAPGTI